MLLIKFTSRSEIRKNFKKLKFPLDKPQHL
nr:MAG TPA: hypothetical protein [Caudoviricetes sp.]